MTPFASRYFSGFTNSSCTTVSLDESEGLVIGHLFTRQDEPKTVVDVDRATSRRITQSRGGKLLESFWGGYIAVLESERGIEVIRDPSGAFPCYYCKSTTYDAYIFASDLETLVASGAYMPAINWSWMTRHLMAFDLRSPETGFIGLFELLAGTRISIDRERHAVESCWTPWDYTGRADNLTFEDASEQLRATVEGSVRAWGNSFGHVLLGVSGGLDSSILASVLSRSSTRTTYYTMATDEAKGDERRYTRILADALGVEVIEAFHSLQNVDLTRPSAVHLPRPILPAYGQSATQTKQRIALENSTDAFFTGIGGDNVFCYIQSATPLIDRFKIDGFSGAFETLDDICRMTGCSVWDALGMAIKRARRPDAGYEWHPEARFLNPAATPAGGLEFTHPWLLAPAFALPGKAVHVSMLVRIQGTIDGFPRTMPPQINPLLSQPIIEFCLGIPSWRWSSEGRNRSVARKAFENLLPPAIVNRKSKGGPASFACDVVESNKAILRDFLLGGLLAQHNLIDRTTLETALSPTSIIRAPDHVRLSALAEAEAWIRHWCRPLAPRVLHPKVVTAA